MISIVSQSHDAPLLVNWPMKDRGEIDISHNTRKHSKERILCDR